ncbi:hypothetical protein MASR2M15_23420 [Anaerolineales bacterium]
MQAISLKKKRSRWQVISLIGVALVIVFILWNTSSLDFIVYPLRLFVTYVHEAGHALVTLLTGGQVQEVIVSPDTSGLTRSISGNRALILPAGYLGAAFFGSILFFIVNRFSDWVRQIGMILGIGTLLFTLLFARPDEGGAITALLVGLGFGALLIGLAWKAPIWINAVILNVLAIMTALNAVLDLWQLISVADHASRAGVNNDAAAFARQFTPLISPVIVAIFWALIAVGMLLVSAYFSILHPLSISSETTLD